jgi:hypothetical protein
METIASDLVHRVLEFDLCSAMARKFWPRHRMLAADPSNDLLYRSKRSGGGCAA